MAGKTQGLSSSKNDIVLTPQLIQSLSIFKANQNKSNSVSNSQLVYGQLGMLSNTDGNPCNQPVLLIPSQSSTRKVTEISNTTMQTNSQKITIPTSLANNANQFIQFIPVTVPTTLPPLSDCPTISLQGMMIMNVNNANTNTNVATKTRVTSVCNKPLVLTINKPSNQNSSSIDTDTSTNLPALKLSLPTISGTNTCTVASGLSNPANSLVSFMKQVNFQSSGGKTKNIAQVQPYSIGYQCKASDRVINSRFAEGGITSLPPKTTSLSIPNTTNSNLQRGEITQKITVEKTNPSPVSFDPNHVKSPNKIVSNQQSTEPCKKHLIPIRETGSARSNGLKPYKRVDTVLFDTMTGLISPINNPSQYPIISEYKSLAVSASLHTNASLSALKSNLWSSAQSPAATTALGTQQLHLKNNAGDLKQHSSGVCLTPIKTEVVDLTEETSENVDLSSKSSKEKKSDLITLKDTVGIVRSDQGLSSPKAKCNIVKSNDTIGIIRVDRHDHTEQVILNIQKNEEVVKSPLLTKFKEVSVASDSEKIPKVNICEENKNIGEKESNINDNVNTNKQPSYRLKETNQNKTVNSSSKKKASTSFDKTSRTFFALDRLYLNRKRWEGYDTTSFIINSLRELRDELIVERSKQRTFLEKNLTHWKQRVENIKNKDVFTKSPAQRLLEKFSLSSFIAFPPITHLKVDNEARKDPLPVDKTGNKSSKDRPKTFNEILEDQRRKKEAKQKATSPNTIETKVTSQSVPIPKVTSPAYTSKTLPEKRKTFADIVEEQKRRKDQRKHGREVVLTTITTTANQDRNRQIDTKANPKSITTFANKNQNKLHTTPSEEVTTKDKMKTAGPTSKPPGTTKNVTSKSPTFMIDVPTSKSPTFMIDVPTSKSPTFMIDVPTSKSPNTVKNTISTAKILTKISKSPTTPKDDISSSKTQHSIANTTTFRTRQLRNYSNPKHPLESAEDRALQHALTLSLKLANREKSNTKVTTINKNTLHEKRLVGLNKRTVERPVTSPTPKKRRTTEIDKLVDCHWNESWLKQGKLFVSVHSFIVFPVGFIVKAN